MSKRKEVKPRRTMRVVRGWVAETFMYFTIYSDGTAEPATRREAEQYAKAYGVKVPTIYGKPEEQTWTMTNPSTTGK